MDGYILHLLDRLQPLHITFYATLKTADSTERNVLREEANKKVKKRETKTETSKKTLLLDDHNKKDDSVEKGETRSCKNKNYFEFNSDKEVDDGEGRDEDVVGQNLRLVCSEFGKNGEMWLRCVLCEN
ncbi:hypothetical protein ILUMI_22303 [Ignelater luminosus]|uniref:Uncharacterized protein n=1 Tax=Ignelater luminosus TaxID=2038154 RepID=A0A8K0G315_IGNLU|nr:hypothetical protein ILUMI_22303 [Ignelater luminosus]